MADQEQLERLTRSTSKWNQWRRRRPDLRPDLNSASLSGANLCQTDLSWASLNGASLDKTNLSGSDLSWASLNGTHLSGADLSGTSLRWASLNDATLSGAILNGAKLNGAILIGAILSGAKLNQVILSETKLQGAILSEADLREANLSRSDLSRTKLHRADLSRADLSEAILTDTDLSEANLSKAHFNNTHFARIDLSRVYGLETANHTGPSTINLNSVILPPDEHTRKHFLQGIGFTQTQIEYLPSLLIPRPIEYQSLFISYASQDQVIAKRLHTDLRRRDVPCWFALHDLQPGNYFRECIDQAIYTQDKLLLLLSEHSVKSGWVRYEVEQALSRENRQQKEILFPIRLDDAIFHCTASWATSLQATRHIGDFTGWQDEAAYNQAFTTLLQHLKVAQPPTASL